MLYRHVCLIILFALTLLSRSTAGIVHPSLRETLSGLPDTSRVRVLARLADRADLRAIDGVLKLRKATRQERHRLMVGVLQAKAEATQGSLLQFLGSRPGSVGGIRTYWIDNLVEFSGTPAVIEEVAARADVEIVFEEPLIFYDPPVDIAVAPDRVNSVEAGLRAIRAPQLWSLGITGAGSIVMNIDTGVKGDHVALASRWRGALPGVPPQQAWYHPSGSTFPVDSDNPGHGTHTMGTMTGCDPLTGDTVGVAPGATWIAGAGNYVGAFQWAADPDGNPFTLTDVPDVINCSWFTSGDPCGGGGEYWALMDNVELVGSVVIWSAGNCGPGGSSGSCVAGVSPGPYMTLTPPKNRASSDVNAFAVGALDGNAPGYPIASFSSRGPSACDTAMIKPEVSAPGVNVRSTIAAGSYALLSGTSMSAPHVSGAVALLRQVNPDADADQIKLALLLTARDLGVPGEDNAYGMGLIDAFAAAEMVSRYQITGMVTSSASGLPLDRVRVRILETGQERRSDSTGAYAINPLRDTIHVVFSAFAFQDTTVAAVPSPGVPLTLNVALDPLPAFPVAGTVTDSATGSGVAAQLRWFALADSSGGPIYTVVSQDDGSFGLSAIAGTYRVEILPPVPYPDKVPIENVIVTSSGATLHVSLAEARILLVDDDNGAPYDTLYRNSLDRLGVSKRRVDIAGGSTALDSTLNMFAGRPVLLWFTGSDTTNAMTVEERNLVISHLLGGGNAIISGQNIAQFSAAGDTLLESYLGIGFTGNAPLPFLLGFPGDVIGNGVNFIISGGAGNQNSKDIVEILPGSLGLPTKTLYYGADTTKLAGVRVLGPGATWGVVYFGFGLEGLSPVRIDTFVIRSLRYFGQLAVGVAEDPAAVLPEQVILEQNYPNPFNPSTTFEFSIPNSGFVTLKVFDLLGREVATLLNEERSAGVHTVQWEAKALSSGVYLYKLQVAGRDPDQSPAGAVRMRKMLILR